MTPLKEIEKLTKDYAEAREILSQRVQGLEEEVNALKRKALPYIRKSAEAAARRKSLLDAAIEGAPELFVNPRTVTIHSIKVGMQKGKGKIEWDDDAQVVKLIRKHFPEQSDVLVKTTDKPVKKALAQLTVAELKKLGIEVEETGDQVVIKSMDSEIDKLVNALLKDDIEEA
ncbi:MAG TPA: hypothetical protein ENG80_00835 [Nitrospirae bacterium]|nr:hypothetical protein [Nitrospirota bacterium]HDH51250.1 hypothetical protein [Nitrospirota bacterium]HDK81031.1 hypothetical protein [Nitrospirota bacterium]